jgi:hypothetical protein
VNKIQELQYKDITIQRYNDTNTKIYEFLSYKDTTQEELNNDKTTKEYILRLKNNSN